MIKRFGVLSAMVVAIVVLVAPLTPVAAFENCLEKQCRLNLDCLVECGPCDSDNPIIPGHCTR